MTPWGKALYDQRQGNLSKDDPEGVCLPPGVPRASGVPYPEKIYQTPDALVILYESRTMFRQIFLDGRKTIPNPQPTWMGYSTGRWDGDVLVVQTEGFNDKTWLDATGKPHSEAMHLTERFRRPDLGHLNVDLTIEDPKALTKPYSFTRSFTLAPTWELQEYVCQAILDGVY